MQHCSYAILIALLAAAIGTTVYLYRGVLFGNDDGVVFLKTYMATIIFGATAFGSKPLSSDYPAGPRRFAFVRLHGSAGRLISYLGIVVITVLFGLLLYIDNAFVPTALEYSHLLYYGSHVLVGLITGAIITMSWIISSKL